MAARDIGVAPSEGNVRGKASSTYIMLYDYTVRSALYLIYNITILIGDVR